VQEPNALELARRLREICPTNDRAAFDEDFELVTGDDDEFSTCAPLLVFSHRFGEWVAGLEKDPIVQGLGFMNELLKAFPDPPGIPRRESLANAIFTCFFENVLPVPAAAHQLVVPNLGPEVRAHAESYEHRWLEPDPGA
jgi:hypothetical protein